MPADQTLRTMPSGVAVFAFDPLDAARPHRAGRAPPTTVPTAPALAWEPCRRLRVVSSSFLQT